MFWYKKIAWPKNFSINKKKMVIILVVIIVLIGTVYAFKNTAPKPKQATIDKTVKRTIAETATETGNIEAKYRNNIALDSSQKVIKIAVKEGQLVKKGELLLELDSSDYQIKLDKALINLENANLTLNQMLQTGIASEKSASENLYSQAKYNLEIAQRKYDDLKKKNEQNEELFTSGAIAQSQLDESRNNLKDSETGVKGTEDALRNAEKSLKDINNSSENKIANQRNQISLIQKDIDDYKKKIEDSKIKSNIDGKVMKINAKENQFPNNGDEIIVDDVSQYKVVADLKQYEALKVQKGQKANVNIKGSKNYYIATVDEIGELAEAKTTSAGSDKEYKVNVSVVIDDPKEEIKAGYESDVQFIFKEKDNCITVGFDGIKEEKKTGEKYVFVVDNDNKVSKRYIKTGIESEYYVEITEGLEEDENYILNPPESILEGDIVVQGTSGKTSTSQK